MGSEGFRSIEEKRNYVNRMAALYTEAARITEDAPVTPQEFMDIMEREKEEDIEATLHAEWEQKERDRWESQRAAEKIPEGYHYVDYCLEAWDEDTVA